MPVEDIADVFAQWRTSGLPPGSFVAPEEGFVVTVDFEAALNLMHRRPPKLTLFGLGDACLTINSLERFFSYAGSFLDRQGAIVAVGREDDCEAMRLWAGNIGGAATSMSRIGATARFVVVTTWSPIRSESLTKIVSNGKARTALPRLVSRACNPGDRVVSVYVNDPLVIRAFMQRMTNFSCLFQTQFELELMRRNIVGTQLPLVSLYDSI
jgi:hypothetical protein